MKTMNRKQLLSEINKYENKIIATRDVKEFGKLEKIILKLQERLNEVA